MVWALAWTKDDAQLLFYHRLTEKNILKPEQEEPYIGDLDYYINCFSELSTCRINGGPIPFTSMAEFSTIKGIDDFEDFHYLMRTLDQTYLEHQEKNNGNTN